MLELKSQNEAAEMKLELQKQYYSMLKEQQKETDAMQHDMRKHLSLIKNLQNDGHKEITDDYINDLEDRLESASYVIRTPHPVISALLSIQSKKAAKLGIAMHLDVRLSSELCIEPADLCILLGNMLENATEACMLLPSESDKYINAELIQKDNMLLLNVKNPYNPKAKKPAVNTKRGYGLKNIEKVVKKYTGQAPVIKKDNGIFHIRIII